MFVRLNTLKDPRLDAYARLTDVQLRNRLEPELGIFIAESPKVIERALDAGAEPVSLLDTERLLPTFEPLTARSGGVPPSRAAAA